MNLLSLTRSMIGQYLLNTNEIGTIHILQKNLKLNKALVVYTVLCVHLFS
jgi:hypothetical protein